MIKNTLQVSEKEPKLTHLIVNESLLTDNNTYINIFKLFWQLDFAREQYHSER